MPNKSLRELSITAGAILAGAALASAALPALAQSTVEELTVTGRYGGADNVRSLSQTVSYADLDLATDAGKHEFRHRISLTARYLCDKLGENDAMSAGPIPTCREAAERDANGQADKVIAQFSSRAKTWVAGRPWAAPYPQTWVEKYPD